MHQTCCPCTLAARTRNGGDPFGKGEAGVRCSSPSGLLHLPQATESSVAASLSEPWSNCSSTRTHHRGRKSAPPTHFLKATYKIHETGKWCKTGASTKGSHKYLSHPKEHLARTACPDPHLTFAGKKSLPFPLPESKKGAPSQRKQRLCRDPDPSPVSYSPYKSLAASELCY